MTRYNFISENEVHDFLPILRDGKWGLVSKDDFDKEIVAPTWDTPPAEYDEYILVEDKELLGLLNRDGKQILSIIYKQIYVKADNRILVCRMDGKYGILNKKGNEVIPVEYDDLDYYSEKMIIASKNGKIGIITIKQKIVVPFMYDKIYYDKVLKVQKDGLYGVITTTNEMILDCMFESMTLYDWWIMCIKDGKAGVYAYDGKVIINPTEYDYIHIPEKDMFLVKKDKLWGLLDSSLNVIIPCKYGDIDIYKSNEHIVVRDIEGKVGLTDKTGNVICEPKYDYIGRYQDGMLVVKLDEKIGFINKVGKLVVPPIYDTYRSFQNGYAPVARNGKWTLVNTEGKEILPLIYDNIEIRGSRICVTYGWERGFVKL